MDARCKSVLIASPDPREREAVSATLSAISDFRLIATARNLMECYAEIESRHPGVVLVAAVLTTQPEFEVMRALFETLDVRWLRLDRDDAARDRACAPRRKSDLFGVDPFCPAPVLAAHLREVSRHRRAERPPVGTGTAGRHVPPSDRLILIGASTGGIDALLQVLRKFPPDAPPTLIVQHTGKGFGAGLVDLLRRNCQADIRHVEHETVLRPGLVAVGAGSGAHLVLRPGRSLCAALEEGPPVSGHVPSVDMLFRSALPVAGRCTAALLTGMGSDGAQGLKALHDHGAQTVAQDEASSVVFGMPRAAIRLGAADIVLPIDRIGPHLLAGTRSGAASQGVAS